MTKEGKEAVAVVGAEAVEEVVEMVQVTGIIMKIRKKAKWIRSAPKRKRAL